MTDTAHRLLPAPRSRRSTGLTLAVLALAGAFTVSAAAPAAATPTPAEFIGTDSVQVVEDTAGTYFAPGTSYFTLQVSAPGAAEYIASWERESGVWSSPEEATNYLATGYATWADCRMVNARQFVAEADIHTNEEFLDAYGTGDGTYWDFSQGEWATIEAPCGTREWNWNHVAETWDQSTETLTARIPLDVMGPGTHQVFLQPLDTACAQDATGSLEAACVLITLDGVQTTVESTRLQASGAPYQATITVPAAGAAPSAAATPTTDQSTPEPSRSSVPLADATPSPVAAGGAPIWLTGVIVAVIGVFVLAGIVVAIVLLARRSGNKQPTAPGAVASGFGPVPPVPVAPAGSWATTVTPAAPASPAQPAQWGPPQQTPPNAAQWGASQQTSPPAAPWGPPPQQGVAPAPAWGAPNPTAPQPGFTQQPAAPQQGFTQQTPGQPQGGNGQVPPQASPGQAPYGFAHQQPTQPTAPWATPQQPTPAQQPEASWGSPYQAAAHGQAGYPAHRPQQPAPHWGAPAPSPAPAVGGWSGTPSANATGQQPGVPPQQTSAAHPQANGQAAPPAPSQAAAPSAPDEAPETETDQPPRSGWGAPPA